jgi:hypothetical protein
MARKNNYSRPCHLDYWVEGWSGLPGNSDHQEETPWYRQHTIKSSFNNNNNNNNINNNNTMIPMETLP